MPGFGSIASYPIAAPDYLDDDSVVGSPWYYHTQQAYGDSMIYLDVDVALGEVPVNSVPLTDATDFVTIEDSVAYNASGMALIWHFITSAGAYTATSVTPTTGGDYDWANQTGGMYTIAMPASGGASINNDTEGYGWFTGSATGVLPWRGPTICLRAAGLNDLLCDNAFSTTRGLAGTALPDAAADAPNGLPISDAGGLDLDAKLANTNEVTAARMGALTDWIDGGRLDLLLDGIKAVTDMIPDGGALTDLLASIALILADTAELQGDWADDGRLDVILDTVLADTTNIKTRIPAALVSGRMDASVGAMAANVLTAEAIADSAITQGKLASNTYSTMAQTLAQYDMASSDGNAANLSIYTLVMGAFKSSRANGVWTIYQSDGATTHVTATLTETTSAEFITSVVVSA